ncbi:MAG: hypothetical protein V4813_06025 [Gemmatimonadota bacterium]
MYTTCIHCNADLGRNEAFETFPVGVRLAFDAAKGRLWVVCRQCARWNLTPLDERWETIEVAERRYRDSRLRVTTDNVGMARLREGVDLIRIGAPQRPEMAAWRYGDQFGRRRKRQMMVSGVVLGSAATLVGGIIAVGVSFGAFSGIWANATLWDSLINGRPGKQVARIVLDGGDTVTVQRRHARMSTLERTEDFGRFAMRLESDQGTRLLFGDEAMRVAARLMPTVNRFGGSKAHVAAAVDILEEIGDPVRVLHALQQRVGAREGSERWNRTSATFGTAGPINAVPGALHSQKPADRLALEMALHEESERRAMDGEMAMLEAAWREAEEIAHIADTMFVPDAIEGRLETLRRGDAAARRRSAGADLA